MKAHVHVCPIHVRAYSCPKLTARCLLPARTVAECPSCAADELAALERGRRFWAPVTERRAHG